VRYVGLTHSNIHVVDFEEDMFKGILSYEEVLQNLPNDVTRQKFKRGQEEMKRVTIAQFCILLQQEQVDNNVKEQEKARKEEKLEKRRLWAKEEYQRRQVEEKIIKK
jgi:hypothetical protein